ncbi:MAG: carboxypeptidase-like regulatory domain-containing protein, partial [Paludibacteraceae bacterium]|nr:carboxypeptidase-like regulatory domain-containing protein [Paludibacteraceae bacterium]
MRHFLVGILLSLPLVLLAKNYTINGYVTDKQTGERLIGAAVIAMPTQQGTTTNNSGFYSLTIKEDSVQLFISYVGYEPLRLEPFLLNQDTVIQAVLTTHTELQEVTVEAHSAVSGVHAVQMSAVEVPINTIKGIPAIGGEVDILKAIQLLPGVQSGAEGSAGMY